MSILEITRANHEDVELIQDAASRLLLIQSQRGRDSLMDHGVDLLSREVESRAVGLLEIHRGSESRLTDESYITGKDHSADIWHRFYSQIKEAKECARMNADQVSVCSPITILFSLFV